MKYAAVGLSEGSGGFWAGPSAERAVGIAEALGLRGAVAAFVGCGGKTTLIERLAASLPGRTLIAPTTKMFPPKTRRAGVDCLGRLNPATGKLEAVPADELAAAVARYDVVLLEADGSRALPCKGWRADEPVVPPYCTHTIGVVTLSALGRPADAAVVHRLPEFLALTGLNEGEIIDMRAMLAMTLAPGGMFKNSAGEKILLVNKVEDESAQKQAVCFLRNIQKRAGGFMRLLYGSAIYDGWTEML